MAAANKACFTTYEYEAIALVNIIVNSESYRYRLELIGYYPTISNNNENRVKELNQYQQDYSFEQGLHQLLTRIALT